MIKIDKLILAMPILLFLIPVSAYGGQKDCGKTAVAAVGKGTVRVVPSGSTINASIVIFNKSHETAYLNLVKKASGLAAYLKGLPYLKSLKTVYAGISPYKIYKNGEWKLNGYYAREDLVVNISGNKNTGGVLLFLLKDKDFKINGITPVFTGIERHRLEAIILEYEDTMAKIRVILDALNVKTFRIEKIDIRNVQPVIVRPLMNFGAKALSSSAGSPNIYFHGSRKIISNVYVELVVNK